jgi:PIN domain nuclease of toxin-antitoxin system
MAIKVSLGRLMVPLPFTDLVAEHVYGNAIELFGVSPRHLDVLTTLPFYHKDPFDRLIIAQGQAEDIPILSRDPAFDDYAIRRLWT